MSLPSRIPFGSPPTTLALVLVVIAAGGPTAFAQKTPATALTARALIGDSVSNPKADRYSDVAEAIKRFKNRDQLSARTFLERAVQKDKKLPPVGVMLAKMQLISGNGAAVRPALEQAVQEDSANDPEPFLLLGEEALANGRTIEADALFDKAAVLIDSYNANAKRKRRFIIRAYRGRAVIAERRKNWTQAEADLRKWLEQDPEASLALNRLGQVLFMLDKPTEGYRSFVEAKKANEDLPNPYVSTALMYGRKGDMKSAILSFEKAYNADPSDEKTLVAYAQVLVKKGDKSKAASVLKKAQANAPNSANVWLLSGVAARMAGDLATAESHFMRAVGLAPSNRDTMNQLAQTLVETTDSNNRARALQFATVNAQLNPNNPDINITHAWVLFQNGQGTQATQALRKGLQGGALSPDGSFLLAKMLLARNDTTNAKRLLESALENEQGIFVQKEQAQMLLKTL